MFNKELSVYLGKFRNQYGYAESYKGKSKTHLHARNLVIKQSKNGDRVILKDGTKVVKTGRIKVSNDRSFITGNRIKFIEWDK